MTKVTENGQLEWTFEELDFEGAIVEIAKECEKILVIRDYLSDKRDFSGSNLDNFIRDDFKSLGKKFDVLHVVWGYLNNLRYGKNWNYKRGEK